jgi:hypothetical protein
VSYGGDVDDTSQIRIFSTGATFVRSERYTFIPNDTGESQMSFRIEHPATTVMQNDRVPAQYELFQNYPNPFNPSTTIRYGLAAASRVSLSVFNILGQKVVDLVNTVQTSGWFETTWNAGIASGLYFYRLEAVDVNRPNHRFIEIKKMFLMR